MASLWFGLISLILVGAGIAKRTPIPNPVIWALLGLGVSFIPGIPSFRMDPEIALFLVLPPLVYASAVQLPWTEFRDNIAPIGLLAIGLVATSTIAVALLLHRFAQLSWPVAFALGAIVSPTDPVAASAVASRVGLPRRLVAILEGEGLVNDAVSLSILRIAIAAWAGSAISFHGGVLRLLAILIGEPLYGWLLGKFVAFVRSRITDPEIEITVSLLTPFAAYLIPETLGGSGILATVAVGMYIGERSSTLIPSGTRLRATSFWQMIVFLLNGGLFMTAGMQLGSSIRTPYGAQAALLWGLWSGAVVIAVRVVWCVLAWVSSGLFRTAMNDKHPRLGRSEVAVVAWSGMRGPISLAAALAIPASLGHAGGQEFETVVTITAVVIVMTLLGQGAVLPALVRLLGLHSAAKADETLFRRQQALGEVEAARAALDCLAELERRGGIEAAGAARFRRVYQDRLEEASTQQSSRSSENGSGAIRSELIQAERSRILELRRDGRISDHALQRLERALDLREALID